MYKLLARMMGVDGPRVVGWMSCFLNKLLARNDGGGWVKGWRRDLIAV